MKFLDAIAAYYHNDTDQSWQLFNYTFVFPNQRSSNFFKSAMDTVGKGFDKELSSYRYITMSELMEKTAGLRRATPNRLLIWLYVAYCKVRRRHRAADGSTVEPEEFDRFRFWGEMLLRDFDQVDRYLVNYRELFKNVKDFKEIQSTYLTDDQLDIIRTYWGDDPYWGHLDSDTDSSNFWRHISGPDGPEGRFAMLWQMLAEVYEEFRHMLLASNLCYPGLAYRKVADMIKADRFTTDSANLHYVFIGFSDLSHSELALMRKLQMRGQADFFWDYDPDLMGPDGCSMAGNAIRRYMEKFPQPTELDDIRPKSHKIDIVAIPSNTGQVKFAMPLLTAKSALVMPSEELLLPVLSSLPANRFPEISVSMGYPLRQTEVASLFSQVVSLQLRLIRHSDGSLDFFREDVMAIIAHPIIADRYREDCQAIVDYLDSEALYNLPAASVEGSGFEKLAPILTPVSNGSDATEVTDYCIRLMQFIEQTFKDEEGNIIPDRRLDVQICSFLNKSIEELQTLIKSNPEVTMRRHTFFHMLESSLFRKPLQITDRDKTDGLQVLGVLETRCMSFDNVVMLSMSDNVYPGKRFARSFVPVSLRRGFGMPVPEVAEANMAYSFYRLLSHCSTATLIFDSRTGGMRSGDMSRFLYQLRFLQFNNTEISYHAALFSPVSLANEQLPSGEGHGVVKTPGIMAKINRLRDPKCLKSNAFSASSLKKYINCPLSFYLEYVADLKIPDERIDDVDSPTLGSIYHNVAELLYTHMRDSGVSPITRAKAFTVLDSPKFDEFMRYAINLNKVKLPLTVTDSEGNKIPNPELLTRPISTGDQLLAKMVREMIKLTIEHEPEEFDFLHAEFHARWQWTPAPGMQPINFTMSIDRIDTTEIDGQKVTRIIDYKTGSDTTSFKDVDELLNAGTDKHLGGPFQLMLYCCAYADLTKDNTTPMLPLIYSIKELPKGKYGELSYSKTTLKDYHELEDEFREKFARKLDELFDPSVPFTRCDGSTEDKCRYCKYTKICGVS